MGLSYNNSCFRKLPSAFFFALCFPFLDTYFSENIQDERSTELSTWEYIYKYNRFCYFDVFLHFPVRILQCVSTRFLQHPDECLSDSSTWESNCKCNRCCYFDVFLHLPVMIFHICFSVQIKEKKNMVGGCWFYGGSCTFFGCPSLTIVFQLFSHVRISAIFFLVPE